MSLLLLSGIDNSTSITLSPITMTMSIVGYSSTLGSPPISKKASYVPILLQSASYTPIITKAGSSG